MMIKLLGPGHKGGIQRANEINATMISFALGSLRTLAGIHYHI